MLAVPKTIETDRLILRRIHNDDLTPFLRLMTNIYVTQILAYPDKLKTKKGAKQLLKDTDRSIL